jgi:hypothetical protein
MKRLLIILTLLFGGFAFAQEKKPDAPADNGGWEKVDGSMTAAAPGEVIPAATMVGAAYGFIFVALLVWVGSVASRTRRVEEEIESLRAKLKK